MTDPCLGKKAFRDPKTAARALNKIRQNSRSDKKLALKLPVRFYQCPKCRKYHLTSQPKRRTSQRRS